jgi:formylglycine-generating enzyme required for sulfatase activity
MNLCKLKFLRGALCAAALAVCALPAQAVTIDWVPIGNPGNSNDTHGVGNGAVSYDYYIGKYEVTNSQFVAFLNAKATLRDESSTSNDLLRLYNASMSSNLNSGGINRSGIGTGGDPFAYSVKSGQGNQPVTFVSWYDAIRFANWLHNGQGAGDTETGAYTLGTLGANAVPAAGSSIARNPGAKIFIPSENEWYKAAYYNPTAATYVDFPTGTDATPNSDQPPGALAIQANAGNFYRSTLEVGYNDGYAITGSTSYSSSQNYLTDVGAYEYSPSLYGTFDQGGNVWEWNEALISGSSRGLRGGSWYNSSINNSLSLGASGRYGLSPADESRNVGFRVAMIPEPTSSTLALCAAVGLWWLRRWRK